jgi:hypothetical protein
LSQSLANVAAGVAGHAYDNVSDWFDAPKTPVGQGDKQKLTRATSLTALQAAKIQQEVGFLFEKGLHIICSLFAGSREHAVALYGIAKAQVAPRLPYVSAIHSRLYLEEASTDPICCKTLRL